MSQTSNRPLGFVACTMAASLWGCGFFFGKIALAEMGLGSMVFYRFLFATIALLPLVFTHRPGLNAREWRTLLVASFFGIPVQFLIQFHGLQLTTVSHASLMVGTMPVILAVGATAFTHERLHALGWTAVAASTVGAALIALSHADHAVGGDPTVRGDLYVVLSLVICLFWILLNKQLMVRHSAIVITVYGLVAGTAMLAIYVPFAYGLPPVHGVSTKAWMALIASGLLCTAATTLLWNWGMTQVPASEAGVLLNMEPLIGSLLGVFVLQERLGTLAFVGGALILAAAVTLTMRGPATLPPEPV